MNKELIQNISVINSIMRGAEDKIHNLTGLNVTLEVKENERLIGDDEIISNITKQFATCWNVEPETIYDKSRKRNVVLMRQIIFHYIRYRFSNITLVSLAKHFGSYDHATVMYGIDCINKYITTGDDYFNSFYNHIKQFYE